MLPAVMGVEEGSGVLPQRPTETPTPRNDSTHGATQETPWLPDGYTQQPRRGNLNTANHTTECQALLNTSRFRGDLQWDLALIPPHGSHVDPPSNAEPQDQGLQHQGQGKSRGHSGHSLWAPCRLPGWEVRGNHLIPSP